jgi:hypothetical protein
MPRRLPDRVKQEAGTLRKDRVAARAALTVPAAQAALREATIELAAEQAKLATLKGKDKATARRRCQDRIRILTTDVEIAGEDLFAAMKAAEAIINAPKFRPGLHDMTPEERDSAVPPLTADEIEDLGYYWLFGVQDVRGLPPGLDWEQAQAEAIRLGYVKDGRHGWVKATKAMRRVKCMKGGDPDWTLQEIAAKHKFSVQTVLRMFQNEKGVIELERPTGRNKRRYRTIRIPPHVYMRVFGRITKACKLGGGGVRKTAGTKTTIKVRL